MPIKCLPRAYFCVVVLIFIHSAFAQARPALQSDFANHSSWFNFIDKERIGDLVVDDKDYEVVKITVELLQNDFTRVFDKTPTIVHEPGDRPQVIAGTLNKSDLVERLIKQHSITTKKLKDCFECYQFNYITHNGSATLLIIGADRRGTAYGLIELSRAIGVSPWLWWADVNPDKKSFFSLQKKNQFFNSPSVKYRGIFINDEDFGLLPWAAYNFEKTGNIGQKTYEKVFELLLRLRANTLWPAMHEITKPFNDDPANAKNADRYAIVMGSSHAEPMLRNNVGEWKAPAQTYNFITNKKDVLDYWSNRLETNAAYENLYTLGMRGIHDSGVLGVKTIAEKPQLLNDVLKSQNQLLKDKVGDPHKLPKIFVPYKEVLDVYEKGLNIPSNVTLVWPDDNFGYLRRFANDSERKRAGGAGVYYHFSYLGAPLSYLWLSTLPLDLARVELTRAYDLGAKDVWIFNVGDIKPAEINVSHAMDLAWDIEKTRKLTQKLYLNNFFELTFGKNHAPVLAEIMDEYYTLNYLRKPEHLQYFLPKESPKLSDMNDAELMQRIIRADNVIAQAKMLEYLIPEYHADSFFELVDYPVQASALAHKRFAYLELYAKTSSENPTLGHYFGNQAVLADTAIKALTHKYNQEIQNGKWNYLMNEEPADNIFPSFRISKPLLPLYIENLPQQVFQAKDTSPEILYQAEDYMNSSWEKYEGIGAIKALKPNAEIVVPIRLKSTASYCVQIDIIPIFPDQSDALWKVTIKESGKIHKLDFLQSYNDKNWAQGVLNNYISNAFEMQAKDGVVNVTITSEYKNLLLDKLHVFPKQNEHCE